MSHNDLFGIYVHIPFCVRKCSYCDFLSFPAKSEMHFDYVNSLCKQIRETKSFATLSGKRVASVYIGGGTPSVINPQLLEKVFNEINDNYMILPDAEITIEVNPKTVNSEALSIYRNIGINRLSIGLQSADDKELLMLGRIHSYDDFLRTYDDARNIGFDNINVDIMTALPNQTESVLERTLEKIIGLKPEHISSYSLIVEENTPFYEKYKDKPIMSEDDERKLYYFCRNMLTENGYEHYEISNFSLKGYNSRHNTAYWTGVEYLGFGLGASSYIGDHRIKNENDIKKYIDNPFGVLEDIALSKNDKMEEFMFLGLRLIKGICVSEFNLRFNVLFESVYGNVCNKLIADGLIERDGDIICLTKKGIDYGNYVFASFLL